MLEKLLGKISSKSQIEDYLINRIRFSINKDTMSWVETHLVLHHLTCVEKAIENFSRFSPSIPTILDRLKSLALYESSFPEPNSIMTGMDEDLLEMYLTRFMRSHFLMASTGQDKYENILKPFGEKKINDPVIRLIFGVYWTPRGRYIKAGTYHSKYVYNKFNEKQLSLCLINSTDHVLF